MIFAILFRLFGLHASKHFVNICLSNVLTLSVRCRTWWRLFQKHIVHTEWDIYGFFYWSQIFFIFHHLFLLPKNQTSNTKLHIYIIKKSVEQNSSCWKLKKGWPSHEPYKNIQYNYQNLEGLKITTIRTDCQIKLTRHAN